MIFPKMVRPLLLFTLAAALLAAADYPLGPDSQVQPDFPHGKVTKYEFSTSKVFPGTVRAYWIYVPVQYDPAKPACLMVFQDGGGYVKADGAWRVPVVFDNLIAKHQMPVTIGLFIDPGAMPGRINRSFEYDALGTRYAQFLLTEMLPEVSKLYNISSNPDDRAIAGASSGGIAAFEAAWNRPDAMHRVMSFIGSFTDLRGGDVIANQIRKTEPKPLRVFLQDGDHDLNIYAGGWWLANQTIAAALEFAGYEYKFVTGTDGHNGKQGGSVLPDALRWLWQDYPKPVARAAPPHAQAVSNTAILDPKSEWELVGKDYKFTEGPAADRDGNVYFCDVTGNKIYRVAASDGAVTVFKEDGGGASGLMFGRDGLLYAAEDGKQRIVAWSVTNGSEKVLAENVHSNDIAVSSKGAIYFTDPPGHRVWFIDQSGVKKAVVDNIGFPNGVRYSPDESMLLVDDSWTRWIWSYHVEPDGSLTDGEPFYRLEINETGDPGRITAWPDGLALDTLGYVYAATRGGVQVCDEQGRVVAIIPLPGGGSASNLVFGGPDLQTLYVTANDKVYRRKLARKGFHPWEPVMASKTGQ